MPTPADGESQMPVDVLPEVSAHERRKERAQVDAHVEDREAGVATLILLRIQIADDDADVAFQQSGADDDEEESEVERRQRRERPC